MSQHAAAASAQQRCEAYKKVMRCFVTSGAYDWTKEDALSTLRSVLAIAEDEHLRMRREVQHEVFAGNGAGPSPPATRPSVGHSQPGGQDETTRLASPFDSAFDVGADTGGAGSTAAAAAGSKRSVASATAAAGSKRVKQEPTAGSSGPQARRTASRQRTTPPAAPAGEVLAPDAAPAPPLDINRLIGRKVERNWPQQGGWFEGVISDYRPESGEHCIIYDYGKPSETYEWFRVVGASANACRVKNETIDWAQVSATAAAKGGSRKGGGAPSRSKQQQQQQAAANGGAKQPPTAAAAAAAGVAPAGAPRAARAAGAPGVTWPGSVVGAAKPVKPASAMLAQMNAGITHAEAVQAALAAGSSQEQEAPLRAPPLRSGYLEPPRRRRMRDWSSEEDDSDEDED